MRDPVEKTSEKLLKVATSALVVVGKLNKYLEGLNPTELEEFQRVVKHKDAVKIISRMGIGKKKDMLKLGVALVRQTQAKPLKTP